MARRYVLSAWGFIGGAALAGLLAGALVLALG